MRNLFNDVNENVYSVIGQNGAKNLIPYPYDSDSYSQRDIDFTCLSDGTINANGTNDGTGNSTYNFKSFTLSKGSYIINGCPMQTGTNYRCGIVRISDSVTLASDYGSGANFTLDTDTDVRAFVQVYSEKTANNITFKPMLRLAADSDDTYVPYAKTNRQLTVDTVNKKTTIDSFYGTSNTPAATAAKVITVVDTANNFSLRPGVLVTAKFDYENTANNPTFNVNGTGAKPVYYNDVAISTESLWAGGDSAPSLYVYDGTNWVLLAYSSYSTAQSVNVNPTTTPTADGSIWIETT